MSVGLRSAIPTMPARQPAFRVRRDQPRHQARHVHHGAHGRNRRADRGCRRRGIHDHLVPGFAEGSFIIKHWDCFPKAAEVQLTPQDLAVLATQVRAATTEQRDVFRARAGLTDKPRSPVGSRTRVHLHHFGKFNSHFKPIRPISRSDMRS